MIHLYIDESGSMTNKINCDHNKFFVVSIIKVNDKKILDRNYKRFVSKYYKNLKKIDIDNKIFLNGKFHELKGCALTHDLKRKFVQMICKDNPFELYYIKLNNDSIDENFFLNKARSFNYLLKLFFIHNHNQGNLPSDKYYLHIDERNIKTQAKYQCAEYLNTELILEENILSEPLKVMYFDSANCKFVQIADIFANLLFSNLMNNQYNDILIELQNSNILKNTLYFPIRKKLKKLAYIHWQSKIYMLT